MDINFALNASAAAICLILLLTKPLKLSGAVAAMAGWFFPYVAGTVWSPYKIALLFALVGGLLVVANGTVHVRRAPWLFLLIAVLLTALNYPRFANVGASSYTAATDARWRSPIQLFWTVASIGGAIFIGRCVAARGGATGLLKALVVGATLLAMSGLYELVARPLGLPVRPIWYAPGQEGVGAFAAGSSIVLRVGGLAAEPKQLAKHVLFALVVLMAAHAVGLRLLSRRKYLACLLTLGLCLVMTFSTSAWVAGALSLILIPPVLKSQRRTAESRKFVITLLVAGAMLATIAALAMGSESLWASLEARTTGRTTGHLLEFVAIDHLKDDPRSLLLGYGPGNYSYAFAGMVRGMIWLPVLDSGWLTTVCDFGAIGATALITYFALLIARVWRTAREAPTHEIRANAAVTTVALFTAIIQHTMVNAFELLWLSAGCAYGVLTMARNATRCPTTPHSSVNQHFTADARTVGPPGTLAPLQRFFAK